MLYQPVKRLAGIYNIFQQAIGSAQRILEYKDHPHDVREAPGALELPPFSQSVSFHEIDFRYPETAESALSGISFSVRAGEVLALVGPSGAGKSTLMNLLPRFFDPSSGKILIDGHDTRSLRLQSLRNQIAIVTQETFLFDDTVHRNIAYGRPDVSIETIRDAARAALADDFIQELPEGYDTHLGERGLRLSGGQLTGDILDVREPQGGVGGSDAESKWCVWLLLDESVLPAKESLADPRHPTRPYRWHFPLGKMAELLPTFDFNRAYDPRDAYQPFLDGEAQGVTPIDPGIVDQHAQRVDL
jgi:hypothetical protein